MILVIVDECIRFKFILSCFNFLLQLVGKAIDFQVLVLTSTAVTSG